MDPRGVGGLVGVDLLCERVAPLCDKFRSSPILTLNGPL